MSETIRAPLQDRSRDKLERIYAVALDLLIDGGWNAVTVGEVERRSGVSRSTFYLRFPTRDALVVYTRQRLLDTVEADQSAAFARARATHPDDLDSAVRAAVDAMATVFREHGAALMRIDRGEEVGAGAQAMNVLSGEFRSVLGLAIGDNPAFAPAAEFATQLAFSALVLEIRPRHTFPAHERVAWESFVQELCSAVSGYLRTRIGLEVPPR